MLQLFITPETNKKNEIKMFVSYTRFHTDSIINYVNPEETYSCPS